MKKQILYFVFLILISSSAAFAQTVEQQVAQIRELSTQVTKRIDAGLKDKTSGLHYAAWTIGGERDGQQWRAVGTMKSTAEFWFDGEPNFGEEVNADARKMIRKIVFSYAGAADLRMRSEYLFDEKGELVFAFTDELEADGKTTERRFYFNRGKLIRAVRNGKNMDGKIPAEDSQHASNEQKAAKRLQNIFALMFAE